MRLVITLKPEDAAGLGGEILTECGAQQSASDPCVFSYYVIMDDTFKSVPDYCMAAIEPLTDRGIIPRMVRIGTESMHSMTPLSAKVLTAAVKARSLSSLAKRASRRASL
jgi:arabinogalactan endo-1,4-beta-galactosidase